MVDMVDAAFYRFEQVLRVVHCELFTSVLKEHLELFISIAGTLDGTELTRSIILALRRKNVTALKR